MRSNTTEIKFGVTERSVDKWGRNITIELGMIYYWNMSLSSFFLESVHHNLNFGFKLSVD